MQRLPAELRHMIWEYTWPPRKLIEVVFRPKKIPKRPRGRGSLRPIVIDAEIERSLLAYGFHPSQKGDLVALSICQESRQHTLKRFQIMGIPGLKPKQPPFYLNPSQDAIQLDLTKNPHLFKSLPSLRPYIDQLHNIQTLVILHHWHRPYLRPEGKYYQRVIVPFTGVRRIILANPGLVWMIRPDTGEHPNETSKQCWMRRFVAMADELRAGFAPLLGHLDVGFEGVWCLSPDGRLC